MSKHFRAMRELGCNLVRVHIAGIDPRIYDLAAQFDADESRQPLG